MIRQLVKTVVGQFGSNQTEPVCVASDRDDQKLGEMMTIVMRYAYSLNKMWEVDRRTFENYVISGIVAHKSYYGWNAALNKEDAFVMTVPDNRIFFDTNMKDFRYWDCSIIGEIHDISIGDLLANFSHGSVERAEELRQIYVSATKDTLSNFYQDLMPGSDESLSFLVPRDNGLCRVIEVWRKESKIRVKCHDTLEGKTKIESFKVFRKGYRKTIYHSSRPRTSSTDIGMPVGYPPMGTSCKKWKHPIGTSHTPIPSAYTRLTEESYIASSPTS